MHLRQILDENKTLDLVLDTLGFFDEIFTGAV